MRFGSSGATPKKQLASQPLPPLPFPDGISTWKASDLDALRRDAKAAAASAAPSTKSNANAQRTASNGGGTSGASRNAEVIAAAARAMPALELTQSLCRTIDILGSRSQRAQEIPEVLTSVSRLHENATYEVFLLCHEGHGVGILKIGVKKLFVTHPRTRAMVEVDPLCVLDFFVDDSCQRQGFGGVLFRAMLREARVSRPETLAIDRPSPKFLSFLKKNYKLDAFSPQPNNFVVFDRFFEQTTVSERGMLRRTDGPAFGKENTHYVSPPPEEALDVKAAAATPAVESLNS